MRTPSIEKNVFARCAPMSYAKSSPTETIEVELPLGPVTASVVSSKTS